VEFWGDTVEEVRFFAVADQRSLEQVDQLWAPPCRELLLTDEVRARARQRAEEHPQLAELFDKLAEGHAVEGMESLAPVLVDEMEMLVDLLPVTPPCWCATPSGSGLARMTWWPPARSSSRLRGRLPPEVARRRSTWAPPPTARSPTYVGTASVAGSAGGAPPRSPPMPTPMSSPAVRLCAPKRVRRRD
jgi:hypothetical protein